MVRFPLTEKNDQYPCYINVGSNHPEMVFNQVPSGIMIRVSTNPSNEDILTQNKQGFEIAIKIMDMKKTPCNMAVAKIFLLVGNFFPKTCNLSKIFHKKNVKLSYSCMPNISTLISKGNWKKNLKRNKNTESPNCNCIKKKNCPMEGRCQIEYEV